MMTIPAAWMPAAKIKGIVVHWTGGPHAATYLDREHYHVIIQGDGTLVRGNVPISGNGLGSPGPRASHTLNCNTGWIGVSLCCMAGAQESPFKVGSAPMTLTQWNALPAVLAVLCRRYGIVVSARTVLSHAEVQGTLGIRQRGKWDIAAIPIPGGGMQRVSATQAGNVFRSQTSLLLAGRDLAVYSRTGPAFMSREELKQHQARLQALGFYKGDLDGLWGDLTVGAIAAFQSRNGISPPTNALDVRTIAALNRVDAVGAVISPERATATAADIRDKSPIIGEAEQSQSVATAGAAVAGGAGVFGFVGEVSGYASTVKSTVGEVPQWAWLLILLAITVALGFLAWRAKRIKDRRVAMHNAAEVA